MGWLSDRDGREQQHLAAARTPDGSTDRPIRRTSRSNSTIAPVSTNGRTTRAGIPWVQPAAEGEVGRGPVEVGEHVDVGQVGADEQRRGPERGAPPETAPRQRGADQRVADRVYASLASSSIATLPLSACETGQPSFAFSAARLEAGIIEAGHFARAPRAASW